MIGRLGRFARRLLFPARCAACGALLGREEGFCADCAADLPEIAGERCPVCGRGKGACFCRRQARFYARSVAPFYFDGPMRNAIYRIKTSGKFGGLTTLAERAAQTVRQEYGQVRFDLVCCTPMTRRELRRRGFNQAALLACRVAKRLRVPFSERALRKLFDTRPQKSLSATLRRGNVAGVFAVRRPAQVRGKTILLFDDVISTGATLDECAKMLRLAGAKTVYAAGVCLAKKHAEPEEAEETNSQNSI